VLNVRPDGYVGTLKRWQGGSRENGLDAVSWMDEYYSRFLIDA
jgi:phenol 2-monooxygenase